MSKCVYVNERNKQPYLEVINWINYLLNQYREDKNFSNDRDFLNDLNSMQLGLKENIDQEILGKLPYAHFFSFGSEYIAFNYYKEIKLSDRKIITGFEEHVVVISLDLTHIYLLKRKKQLGNLKYDIINYNRGKQKLNKTKLTNLNDDGSFDFVASENLQKSNIEEGIKRICLMLNN